MSRLSLTLEQLRLIGYEVISCEVLVGGINSSVYLLNCANCQHYVLKLYSMPSSYDPRNRCKAEVDFLQYLGKCYLVNCPKLYEFDLMKGWTLISWINGESEIVN